MRKYFFPSLYYLIDQLKCNSNTTCIYLDNFHWVRTTFAILTSPAVLVLVSLVDSGFVHLFRHMSEQLINCEPFNHL